MAAVPDTAAPQVAPPPVPDRAGLFRLFREMLLIRQFEEIVNELYLQGKIPSTLHLYIGQEAVAAGVCGALQPADYVLSTHRPHGHALAKGVAPGAIMAELYGKATGTCKAKGGSMHVGDFSLGMFPAIAIVGGNVPLAAGAALASKRLKDGRVTACFFGEGAVNEGAWHEGVNAAAIWDLPVLFVCENNLYAASTPVQQVIKTDTVAERARAYGLPALTIDGNDVLAVYQATAEAAARARAGNGPTLIECLTYRQCGHSRSDPRTYRTKDEEAAWKLKDPVDTYRAWLTQTQAGAEAELAAIQAEVTATIQAAIDFAEASPLPDPADIYSDVFA
ncbi:MAG: thiamine pyrophosphate-dependent dehydrogenase E1 component subunit alpha [Anaerolineales bacterium]|nr:thiamine pyrophosphate-dependent dehydrogenase E1 component subunit alpha [Anaerolineales bacterium]